MLKKQSFLESLQPENITIDTLIPSLPADRLPQPDETHHNQYLKSIDQRISDFIQQKKKISEKINQIKSSKASIDENHKLLKDLNSKKNTFHEQLRALKAKFFEMLEITKKIKPKIKIFDKAKAEEKVELLQYRIDNTSLSLQEEKKLITELSELQGSLPLINQFSVFTKKMNENKAQQDEVKATINNLIEEIETIKKSIDEANKIYNENGDEIKGKNLELNKQKKEIDSEITRLKVEKNKEEEKFKQKKLEFDKQRAEIKKIEKMNKIKNQLIKEEEEKKTFAESLEKNEESKTHLFANEIILCDNYISYLLNLVPKQTQKSEKQNFSEIREKKMIQESEEFFGKSKKKKQRDRKKKKKNLDFFKSLPIDLLNFFSHNEIPLPSSVEEVEDTVSILEKMKSDWILVEVPKTKHEIPRTSSPDMVSTIYHDEIFEKYSSIIQKLTP